MGKNRNTISNKNSPKVSVILPVYNVEPYIERCIDSLKAQTLRDLEFIFVDDCSTDDSMQAVEQWSAADGRVRILYNENNSGSGTSRNRGIEIARGVYLGFVDPDDYISPDFFERLYNTALANGPHAIAKGRCCEVDELTMVPDCPKDIQNSSIRNGLQKGIPLFRLFSYEHYTAIYSSQLFRDGSARYGTSITAQDTTFQLRACYQTNDLVFDESALYYYVQRSDSATHKNLLGRSLGEVAALDEKIQFLLQKGFDNHSKWYLHGQVKIVRKRFQEALGKGLVDRDATPLFLSSLAETISQIPASYEVGTGMPQLVELLSGCPLTLPNVRTAAESAIRVSVIIPVFNPGASMGKCIESLRRQLLDGLEFIFIDDCSTDDSLAMAREWAAADSRVTIIRNEKNQGAGPSRNRGIEKAGGDYLSFVDPDDYISNDFYELLYARAIRNGPHDIAKGSCIRESSLEGETAPIPHPTKKPAEVRRIEKGATLYNAFLDGHFSALYKREFIESHGVHYGTTRIGEDTTFLLRACAQTTDIVFEQMAVYFYVQREDSATHVATIERYLCALDALEEQLNFLAGKDKSENIRQYASRRSDYNLTSFYLGAKETPETATRQQDYLDRFADIIRTFPECDKLRQSNPSIRAALDFGYLLPAFSMLPNGFDSNAVSSWALFLANHPDASRNHQELLASALADALNLALKDADLARVAQIRQSVPSALQALTPTVRLRIYTAALRKVHLRKLISVIADTAPLSHLRKSAKAYNQQ